MGTTETVPGWRLLRLDEVAEIGSGVTKGRKLGDRGTAVVPYLRVANVQAGRIIVDDVATMAVPIEEVARFALCAGDVLMTEGGDPDKLGRGAVWDGSIEPCVHQNHVFRVRADQSQLLPKYLEAYLGARDARTYFARCAKQTTGIASINKTQLSAFPVLLPPLPDQRRIAAILDKADGIRRKRREVVRLADEFLKSAFLEMFGDPVGNPRGWRIRQMDDLISDIQYGTADPAKETGDGLPILRMNNLTYDGRIDLASLKWCPIAEREFEQYTVRRGDLLFNRTNSPELVGKTAVWNREERYAFAGYLIRVRFHSNLATPEYVSGWLNSAQGKAYLFAKAKASNNMSNFSAGMFRTIPIAVPPVDQQQRFSQVVAAVAKLRGRAEEAVSAADRLFESLVDRAFSGAL